VDQAGSARMPAAWTGVYSIKPTHGLIPSFGSFHFDHTLDFICPVAKNVSDLAAFLEVLAGEDPRDPQWVRGPIKVEEYTKSLTKDLTGMKIGVIRESFEWDFAAPDVIEGVKAAAESFTKLGASVEEVSLPMWQDALPIWLTLTTHSVSAMIESEAQGFWHKGMALPSFADYFGKARRLGSDHFPPSIKLTMIMGKYLRRNYFNTYFAKAQNLRNHFRAQLDQLLSRFDLLVTPTIPIRAFELLTETITDSEWTERAIANVHNTCPLNISGHPAIAVPCGVDKNKLPISMQLIGANWSESGLIRAAYAFEQGSGLEGVRKMEHTANSGK
jgi:amidase